MRVCDICGKKLNEDKHSRIRIQLLPFDYPKETELCVACCYRVQKYIEYEKAKHNHAEKMKRFEIIKTMNVAELSVFLQGIYARGYVDDIFDIEREPYNKEWLESEAKPYESINTKLNGL